MSYIHGQDRHQQVLFPESLDDYIDAANHVRFLDVFVNRLDLKALDFTHATLNQTGDPPIILETCLNFISLGT
jgi:transposase